MYVTRLRYLFAHSLGTREHNHTPDWQTSCLTIRSAIISDTDLPRISSLRVFVPVGSWLLTRGHKRTLIGLLLLANRFLNEELQYGQLYRRRSTVQKTSSTPQNISYTFRNTTYSLW